jgi:hypothetical protein
MHHTQEATLFPQQGGHMNEPGPAPLSWHLVEATS